MGLGNLLHLSPNLNAIIRPRASTDVKSPQQTPTARCRSRPGTHLRRGMPIAGTAFSGQVIGQSGSKVNHVPRTFRAFLF